MWTCPVLYWSVYCSFYFFFDGELTQHILAVLIGVELPWAEDLAHDGLLVGQVYVVRRLTRPGWNISISDQTSNKNYCSKNSLFITSVQDSDSTRLITFLAFQMWTRLMTFQSWIRYFLERSSLPPPPTNSANSFNFFLTKKFQLSDCSSVGWIRGRIDRRVETKLPFSIYAKIRIFVFAKKILENTQIFEYFA